MFHLFAFYSFYFILPDFISFYFILEFFRYARAYAPTGSYAPEFLSAGQASGNGTFFVYSRCVVYQLTHVSTFVF